MESGTVSIAVEGDTDEPVVRKILTSLGLETGVVHGKNGKGRLDRALAGYNRAARYERWVVLRDLDGDELCASALVAKLLPAPSRHMRLRVAVHEVEAWLLADREGVSSYFKLAIGGIPLDPDSVVHPKRRFIDLCRKSRSKEIREDVVPAPHSSSDVGPVYVARIVDFAARHWNVHRAAKRSASLRRCLQRLQQWNR